MTSHEHHHPHTPSRRSLLAGASGLLILASAAGSASAAETRTAKPASGIPAERSGASRRSGLTQGTTLVHADMHNHTAMSDGDGDPELAFASLRDAGLDVAALTDHATLLSVGGISDD